MTNINQFPVLTERDKNNGFSNPFGSCIVRSCEISVHIVYRPLTSTSRPFAVYVFHGTPAGPFWKNSAPLNVFEDRDAAERMAASLFGIAGSGAFATFHEDY